MAVNESGHLRLRAMANITLDNGARPAEVVTIRVCDVFCDPGEVAIMGKGQRERYVPLGQRRIEFIEDYLRVRPRPTSRDESLFLDLHDLRKGVGEVQPAKDLKPVMEARGLLGQASGDSDFSSYTLRKTFARRAPRPAWIVAELAAIIGHRPGSIPMLPKHDYSPTRDHKLRAHANVRPSDALHE